METPPKRSGFVCGLCGATAEELASPLHPPLEEPMVIRTHGLEAHEVTAAAYWGQFPVKLMMINLLPRSFVGALLEVQPVLLAATR
jgi:hypothetical protein